MRYGLLKTKYDPRDYSHKKTFGSVQSVLPAEFLVGTTQVLNQYESVFCTAFASCILAALEDNKVFSPEWYFSKEAQISGSMQEQDLRTAAAASKTGFLEQNLAQFTLLNESSDFLAKNANWPATDDSAALAYKKPAYFRVDGNFQEIKQALFNNKKAILTGVDWGTDWMQAPNGIITDYTSSGNLHAIPLIGFKQINGIDYLIFQNSYGTAVGDSGLFYVPETIFNQAFTEPFYMFVDTGGVPPRPIGNWLQLLINWIIKLCS